MFNTAIDHFQDLVVLDELWDMALDFDNHLVVEGCVFRFEKVVDCLLLVGGFHKVFDIGYGAGCGNIGEGPCFRLVPGF